jgi:hypothetical protein
MPARPRTELFPLSQSFDAQSQVLELAEQTCRMIAVANAMVASGRRVDLAGLQHSAGLLCAKALDLQPAETGFARIELLRLVTGLDTLTASMRARSP